MRVRQFKYQCKKCGRTITVPGKVGVCPVCGEKFDAAPQEIKTQRPSPNNVKWER